MYVSWTPPLHTSSSSSVLLIHQGCWAGSRLKILQHICRLGTVDEGSPCSSVLHHFLPVGQFCQIFADNINPSQWGSTRWSLLPLRSTFHKLFLGTLIRHSLYVCGQTIAIVSVLTAHQLAILQSPLGNLCSAACPTK